MNPICDKCNRQVEEFEFYVDSETTEIVYQMRCHNEKEEVRLKQYPLTPDRLLADNYRAFKQPEAPKEEKIVCEYPDKPINKFIQISYVDDSGMKIESSILAGSILAFEIFPKDKKVKKWQYGLTAILMALNHAKWVGNNMTLEEARLLKTKLEEEVTELQDKKLDKLVGNQKEEEA